MLRLQEGLERLLVDEPIHESHEPHGQQVTFVAQLTQYLQANETVTNKKQVEADHAKPILPKLIQES